MSVCGEVYKPGVGGEAEPVRYMHRETYEEAQEPARAGNAALCGVRESPGGCQKGALLGPAPEFGTPWAGGRAQDSEPCEEPIPPADGPLGEAALCGPAAMTRPVTEKARFKERRPRS